MGKAVVDRIKADVNEKKQKIKELREKEPDLRCSEIAKRVGCTEGLVRAVLAK